LSDTNEEAYKLPADKLRFQFKNGNIWTSPMSFKKEVRCLIGELLGAKCAGNPQLTNRIKIGNYALQTGSPKSSG